MKKLMFLIFLLPMINSAQVYETGEKTITGIFEMPNKRGAEIYSSVNKWVALNYDFAHDEIQYDSQFGVIIVKGIKGVSYSNPSKLLYPDRKYLPELTTGKFHYTLEIYAKDNLLQVIFRITDGTTEDNVKFTDYFLNCINFNGAADGAINDWNIWLNKNLKESLIAKAKRERYLSSTKSWFNEVNQAIITVIKDTMQSINETVINSKKEDW